MTQAIETDIVKDFQKQEIDSAVITLWEIQLKNNEYAHFFGGLEEDLTTLQFRDREDSSVVNTYTAVPLTADGFEHSADGSSARPTVTFANVLATFSDALQLADGTSISNSDLIGNKIYRRKSLYKYAYGQSGDSPDRLVEFPIEAWLIDRISSETVTEISFELASAYDLTGIHLPRRVIMGNACPWLYKGASEEITAGSKVGACRWNTYGRTVVDGTTYTVYINKKDEYILPSTAFEVSRGNLDSSSDAVTAGEIYRTVASTTGLYKINSSGVSVSPGTVYDYWQAMKTLGAGQYTTPTEESNLFRPVRLYYAYNSSTTYTVYTNSDYNEYVTYDRGPTVSPDPDTYDRLWRVATRTQDAGAHDKTPDTNDYWQFGDVCSKSITGCANRFRFKPYTITAGSGSPNVADVTKREGILPYGGFPATRQFS